MLGLLSTIAHEIDVVLLQPLATTIETVLAAIYYFFAGSCFVGYCLVQAGALIWSLLCDAYRLAVVLSKYCTIFYNHQRHNVSYVWEYIHDGTFDAMALGRNVLKGTFLLITNVLIEIGNCALWTLLLVPRLIIHILDYVVLIAEYLAASIVEHCIYIFNNLFRLSIGIALLLALYTFRGYVYYYGVYLHRKLRHKISRSLHFAFLWMDQKFLWLVYRFQNKLQAVNVSGNSTNLCVVCLERKKNIVILPCRHLCLCHLCSIEMQLYHGGNRCPICRHDVSTRMIVFD